VRKRLFIYRKVTGYQRGTGYNVATTHVIDSLGSGPCTYAHRHAPATEHERQCLIAFDDLLWLRDFRTPHKHAVCAMPIPPDVLELFVTRGLVERQASWVRLTASGMRALEHLK
jgi:hypothetical protein